MTVIRKATVFFAVGFLLLYLYSMADVQPLLIVYLGKFCGKLYEILPNLSNVILTSGLVYILFGRSTEKLVQEIMVSPEVILNKIPRKSIDEYFQKYICSHHKLDSESTEACWKIINNQFLALPEYHKNVNTTISIIGVPDERGYRKLRIATSYQVFNPVNKDLIRLRCSYCGDPISVIHDDRYVLSWIFVPNKTDNCLPVDAFRCVSMSVDGESVLFTDNIAKNSNSVVEIQSISCGNLHGKLIRFEFEVLQYAGHGFVSNHLKRLTETYTISLNYVDAPDVDDVYVIEFLLSNRTIEKDDAPRVITRTLRGWIAQKSGVSFTWVNN